MSDIREKMRNNDLWNPKENLSIQDFSQYPRSTTRKKKKKKSKSRSKKRVGYKSLKRHDYTHTSESKESTDYRHHETG